MIYYLLVPTRHDARRLRGANPHLHRGARPRPPLQREGVVVRHAHARYEAACLRPHAHLHCQRALDRRRRGSGEFYFFHSVYDLILHNFNAIIKGIFF